MPNVLVYANILANIFQKIFVLTNTRHFAVHLPIFHNHFFYTMKKIIYFIVILFIGIVSCKKDKPDCPTCQNGGVCNETTGKCDCPGYWVGDQCDTQGNPNGVFIEKITLDKMPSTDANGAGWDLTSGADVFLILKMDGKTLYTTRASFVQNASAGISWNPKITLLGLDIFKTLEIEIWDFDDFDPDDFMGGVVGPIYNITNKYPQTIKYDCSSCKTGYTLSVVYQ